METPNNRHTAMKTKSKTTILYIVQASLNGGKFYDAWIHKTPDRATKEFDHIVRKACPTWRGLSLTWRIVRRVERLTTEETIHTIASTPQGKNRPLIGELFIPSWLPKRIREKHRNRQIPNAPAWWQPRNNSSNVSQP